MIHYAYFFEFNNSVSVIRRRWNCECFNAGLNLWNLEKKQKSRILRIVKFDTEPIFTSISSRLIFFDVILLTYIHYGNIAKLVTCKNRQQHIKFCKIYSLSNYWWIDAERYRRKWTWCYRPYVWWPQKLTIFKTYSIKCLINSVTILNDINNCWLWYILYIHIISKSDLELSFKSLWQFHLQHIETRHQKIWVDRNRKSKTAKGKNGFEKKRIFSRKMIRLHTYPRSVWLQGKNYFKTDYPKIWTILWANETR